MPVSDATFGQVVWGKLEGDTVAREDTNTVAAQFAGEVRENRALLVELNAKEAAWKFLDDGSGHFDAVFFAHCPP